MGNGSICKVGRRARPGPARAPAGPGSDPCRARPAGAPCRARLAPPGPARALCRAGPACHSRGPKRPNQQVEERGGPGEEKPGPANRPARARLRHIGRPAHSQPGPDRRVCRARFARGGPGEEKTGPAKARSAARERPLLTRPGPAGAPARCRARPTYVRGPSYIRRLPISRPREKRPPESPQELAFFWRATVSTYFLRNNKAVNGRILKIQASSPRGPKTAPGPGAQGPGARVCSTVVPAAVGVVLRPWLLFQGRRAAHPRPGGPTESVAGEIQIARQPRPPPARCVPVIATRAMGRRARRWHSVRYTVA